LEKPASLQDADLMLREARNAIERGQLDDAEKIIQRVESGHINYSVFHVGPTPTSVRRELARAQKSKPGAKTSSHAAAGSKNSLPFARNGNSKSKSSVDPFANNRPASAEKTVANTSGKSLDSVTAPGAAPVKQAGGPEAQPSFKLPNAELPAAQGDLAYPVTQASGDLNPMKSGEPDGSITLAAPGTNAPDPYAPRQLGSSTSPSARKPSPKQQVQTDLAAAREALKAGDLAQAEKLTRAASQRGVTDTEYAPNDDRPSLVAWEIAQAKQKSHVAQAASPISRLPATAPSRYADPSVPTNGSSSRYSEHQAQAENSQLPPEAQLTENHPANYRSPSNYGDASPAALPLPTASSRVTSNPSARITPAGQPGDGPNMLAAASQSKLEPPAMHIAQASPANAEAASELPSEVSPTTESLPLPQAQSQPLPPQHLPATEVTPPVAATPPAAEPLPPVVNATPPARSSNNTTLIDKAEESQQALARQLSAEVGKRQSEAQRLLEKDPERALATLHEAQKLVNDSNLPESMRRELLSRIDITLQKTEHYNNDHKAEIELDKQNATVKAEIDRDREMKLKMQQKVADMVNEFNRLRDEHRYSEMEIIARRLIELAPDDPVAQQTWQNAKFIRREMINRQLASDKEGSVWEQLNAVEQSSVNNVAADGHELAFDQKHWDQFVTKRKGSKELTERRTERELEIERRLKTPVLLKYQETPLSEVMEGLSELTGVNIHLDPRGLSQEGVNTDSPVTINLSKEVQLKSALHLILEPLHLSYVISDEVLKVTSEQLRDGELKTITYNVADLVTPIPNFVPSNNIGLQGMINDSMAAAGRGSKPGFANNGPTVLVNDQKSGQPGENVLAQQFNASPTGQSQSTVPIGAGPGGMGAGANADFDSLIDLIVSTVSTDTWAENGGGEAEIRPFPTNLSLVVSQTQAVHEEIADLLQQLRRLQDLQVTIEVRFIRLNDSFFERIGIDFDMDINDNGVTAATANQFQPVNPDGHSNTVGLQQPAGTNVFPNFTTDLDIPFRQGSFDVALPPFGPTFDPNAAANFGFAILSDIEAFFLIQAAQADTRTNVLNAPKVTLFNGQQAFVADATQRPFVVGVIPVVGEFAAAQQPVIVVLNEGTMMTIQAVVSEDRRYVRMTIVPFFTQIGDVDTFTFEGSSSTTNSSSTTDDDDDGKNEKDDKNQQVQRSGVTVQLPSFSFVSVVTTVSVPDGGTVLLGGIKRLSEGRNEFGVPLLSKVPYINRLFRNVGIGRTTDSLMMMVTPRIIIQEEEEERLGIATP
jgi:general secretion pathway protein D